MSTSESVTARAGNVQPIGEGLKSDRIETDTDVPKGPAVRRPTEVHLASYEVDQKRRIINDVKNTLRPVHFRQAVAEHCFDLTGKQGRVSSAFYEERLKMAKQEPMMEQVVASLVKKAIENDFQAFTPTPTFFGVTEGAVARPTVLLFDKIAELIKEATPEESLKMLDFAIETSSRFVSNSAQ